MNTRLAKFFTRRRIHLFGIIGCLLVLVAALILGAYSVWNWISTIEAMFRAQVESPSEHVGFEALVDSALLNDPHELSRSVEGAKVPLHLKSVLSSIESQLSHEIASGSDQRSRPCTKTDIFQLMPSQAASQSPIDQYVTETEHPETPNPTFLYVPAALVRVPPKGDTIKALECFDTVLLNDIERTRSVSQQLKELTTNTLLSPDRQDLNIVQAFIISVRGIIRITENESVAKSQQKYYSGQFEPNIFFARTAYFKNTVAPANKRPTLPTDRSLIDVKEYFTISKSYLDLGGNGIVTTICRSLDIQSPRDSVLCMDVSATVPTDKLLQMHEIRKVLDGLGADTYQGDCRVVTGAQQQSHAECDKEFGEYRDALEKTIDADPNKQATIFGQLRVLNSGRSQFLFTIPVKSSKSANDTRQQTLLLCRIGIVGLRFKGFFQFALSGILVIGAALVAFVFYKQVQVDSFMAYETLQSERFMREVHDFHDKFLHDEVPRAKWKIEQVKSQIARDKLTTLHPIPLALEPAICQAESGLADAIRWLNEAFDKGRKALNELETTYGKRSDVHLATPPSKLQSSVKSNRDPAIRVSVTACQHAWSQRFSSVFLQLESVYHIVREALLNALEHADAREITVDIDCSPKRLVIQVIDDGRGIQTSARGAGMVAMERRAIDIGAGIEFINRASAQQSTGTIVRLELWQDLKKSHGA